MRKIFISLFMALFVNALLIAQEPNLFDAGSKAYSEAKYTEAIDFFKKGLEESNPPTAELYYNLGCAYYKNGDIAEAILCFERAYRIDQSDRDIRFNLKLANSQIVDKMKPLPKFFFARWLDSAMHWFSREGWTYVNLIVFYIFGTGVYYFIRGKRQSHKKIGFYVGLVFLVIFIFAQILTIRLHHFIKDKDEAILMSEIVTVKSSPDSSAKDIVIIHSGLKVIRLQELGGFSEVKLPDGTIGWIPNSSFEIINNFEE